MRSCHFFYWAQINRAVRKCVYVFTGLPVLAVGLLAGCMGSPLPAPATPQVVVVATPDIVFVSAQKTIEAALAGGAPFTPSPTATMADVVATSTAQPPSPPPTATLAPPAEPTTAPTPTVTPNWDATATAQAQVFATAVAATLTAQATPTSTPDQDATFAARMATSVAATLTAQVTPTPTPNQQATLRAQMETAVAATLTAQPSPTWTPNYGATQAAGMATSVAATLTAQPPTRTPIPPPPPPVSGLAADLRTASRSAGVNASYRNETDQFIDGLASHMGDFQLPNLGITTNSMTDVLRRRGVGNRINGLVNQVWGGWLGDVRSMGLNAYTSNPSAANLSPFRQLVVRIIQGRQGRLVDNQQHGLYNYFNRPEEDHVWWDNMNGVIGAVNRESFLWP
jgi:hypothetical protein